jgi:REP element-mobilizing transposase RayT
MARPLRIQIPDGVYHVTANGDQGRRIFRDDVDRRSFLGLFARVLRRYRWESLAYCLLGTHYHLLVRTPDPNLASGMQQLNSEFAAHWNKRGGRKGHVLRGRYFSVLVQRDAHLLEAARYIAWNPVEAGICAHPRDWPWSSYRDTAAGRRTGVLDAHLLLAMLEDNGLDYAAFVERAELGGYTPPENGIAGDVDFAKAHLPARRPQGIPARFWDSARPPLSELLGPEPGATQIVKARECGYSLAQIASLLGCHKTTVARRLARAAKSSNG